MTFTRSAYGTSARAMWTSTCLLTVACYFVPMLTVTRGITDCSKPTALWWFNPVDILTDQLLSGATIALPSDVNTILTILRIGQHIMFGFFLAGICLAFVMLFAGFIALRSRWWSLPMAIFAFIDAVLICVASIVGTAMSVGARFALTAQSELNLRADIGVRMFAFMWIASVASVVAFFIHAIMGCCCRIDRPGAVGEQTHKSEKKASQPGRPVLPTFMRRRRSPRDSSSTER
jgi:SUR7/PalI family protein